ncbi:UNVERIFIED_CONTAM: hypothetical protein PYX00_004911 [Menopon gallinae]|uniref:EF-hand domain-containing protein n=1 Tax=Menopon gallinae TaxID=328185 RepID=A0AAW2I8D2_9NEOP
MCLQAERGEYTKDTEKRKGKLKNCNAQGESNDADSGCHEEAKRKDSPQAIGKKAREMDTRKLAQLTEAFHLFDFDRDGIISFSDLKKVYTSLDREDTDEEEIKKMISEGLEPLDFDAFIKLMGYKTLDLDDEEILVEALSQWDYGTGLISEERFVEEVRVSKLTVFNNQICVFRIKHDLMTWGDRFTEEEAEAALEHAPIVLTKNKEKMINYVQFCNDLCGFRRMKNLLKGN